MPRPWLSTLFVLGAIVAGLQTGCSSDPPAASEPSPAAPSSTGGAPPTAGRAQLNAQLIDAALRSDVKQAQALIKDGADVNAKDASEQSAFLIAASEGFLDLLELSLDSGADVASLDSYGGTALIRAAERGHADIVGRLLQTKINVDHVNRLGWTALHEAIWLGKGTTSYLDTVRLLVAGGADMKITARTDGRTPLAMAQERGFKTIETTIRSALDSPTVGGSSALLAAASAGNADQVASAIRNGTDLEARDEHGRTPLLLAVSNDRLAVARLLVPLGADPDAQDEQHDSPWLVTGVTGNVAMANVLLEADPDLTLRNRFGGISIIPAAERGHVDYVRLMTTTATNVNHVNNLGWTALLEAVILGDGSQRYAQIVRILLDAGADPDLADRDGMTPLKHAQRRGHSQIAAELQR